MVFKIGLQYYVLEGALVDIWHMANLMRKSYVNEEELCQVAKHRAVQAAGLVAVEELLVPEPEGEGGQVLVGHAPDDLLLLSADLACCQLMAESGDIKYQLTPDT